MGTRTRQPRFWRTTFVVLASMMVISRAPAGCAELPAALQNSTVASAASELLRWLVVESLPENYEKSDNWGAQHHPLVEHNLKFDGGVPRLEKRTVEVNHGLWRKYRITPIEPDKNLQVRIDNVRTIAPGRTALQAFVTSRLRTEARQERWRYGVKLMNFEIEADATVDVRIDLELAVRSEPGSLVNDFILDPKVTAVHLQLKDLDVDHVSKIHGDVAKELGKALEGIVAQQLHDREPKLVDKLNRSIDKHRDRLRFSPSEWVSSGWAAARDALHLGDNP